MKKVFKGALAVSMAFLASFSMLLTSCQGLYNDDKLGNETETGPVITIPGYNVVLFDKNSKSSVGYDSIKAALSNVKDSGNYVIYLQPGEYKENYIHYNGSATVKISGVTAKKYGEDVVITGRGENMGKEKGRELVEFEGSSNLILENVTLLSDYSRKDNKGDAQAEVVGFDSTGYVAAYNCAFISHQDTMRTTGKGWFYKCYVSGDTDFIWMEKNGVVALYEECEIVSSYDEYKEKDHITYILAPRANVANTMGKGAVIYNSKVTLNNDVNYLCRNVWPTDKSIYTQGAFVNVTFDGEKGVEAVAKNAANGTSDNQYVGWKLDAATASAAVLEGKIGNGVAVLSEEVLKNEYSGRRAILNRNYSVKHEKFVADVDNEWNIDKFIAEQKWTVSEDTSSVLLTDEEKPVVVVYDFTKEKVDGAVLNGFEFDEYNLHHSGDEGSTIAIPVTGPCTVTVTGYFSGNGTIKAGTQGVAKFDFNNNSTTKLLSVEYIVYQKDAREVVLTATSTTYIKNIKVAYDSDIIFRPVASIEVTSAEGKNKIAGGKTVQFNAVLNPSNASNLCYEWSVSDNSIATIDENGLLTAAEVNEEKTVLVVATSLDENKVTGTYELTVVPASANAVEFKWFDGTTELNGNSSNEGIATVSAAVTKGTWVVNKSKFTEPKTGLVVSYDAVAARDDVYIEYPITANKDMKLYNLSVYYSNAGTGNARAYVTCVDADGNLLSVISDDNKTTVRSNTIEYPMYLLLKAGETVKVRVSIHGYRANPSNEDPNKVSEQTFKGKTPGMGNIVISGEAGTFAEPGKSYEWDVRNVSGDTYYQTPDTLLTVNASSNNGGHGFVMQNGNSFNVAVAGSVDITVLTCAYDNAQEITVTSSDGTEIAKIATKGNGSNDADDTHVVSYTGAPDTLTFKYTGASGQNYLHGVKVTPAN